MTPETFAPFCCPGEVDALVLGAAGLQRLDLLRERPHAFLSFQQMLPAPCQGAVGAVARRDMDPELARACALADDAVARIAAAAERAALDVVDAGKTFPATTWPGRPPLSAYMRVEDDNNWRLQARVDARRPKTLSSSRQNDCQTQPWETPSCRWR